jgi:CRP-like cAMP-binding protein
MTEDDLAVISRRGWLAQQPAAFRAEVLERALVQSYEPGKALYHLGDPPGGIYGLVSGMLRVTTAPGAALPRTVHMGTPGFWTGEGPYMIGGGRRIELRAASACQALHLPLETMEQMTAADPAVARRFGQIPLVNIDLLLRMVHDLLIKDPDRRIGAVLLRATAGGTHAVPLPQDAIGDMACATRKQVNLSLKRLAAAGWIAHGYRSVAVIDAAGLRAFVAVEDEG